MSAQDQKYEESMLALEDQKIADLVIQRYMCAKNATQKLRQTHWPKYLKMYLQQHEEGSKYQYRSKIYVPLVFGQVQILAPYIMQTIFSSDPTFKLNDMTGLKKDAGTALEKLIECQTEEMGLYGKLDDFVLNMLIYGTSVAKVYWESDITEEEVTKKVKKIKYNNVLGVKVPVGIEEVEESDTEEVVNYNGPVFSNIDLQDFYIDPKAEKLQGYWKGHVITKSFSELKKANKETDGKMYKNLNELEAIMSVTEKGDSDEDNIKRDRKVMSGVDVASGQSLPNGKIRLFEYWTSDDSEFYVVALDYGITIRKAKNVFKHKKSPFVFARFVPTPGEFYGQGIPSIVYGLQRNANSITNQRNDNINLIINRMWKYKRDSGINVEKLKSAPGNFIGMDELDDVDVFDTPDVTQSAYTEVAMNKAEAQEAIGTKYISGANPTGSNRTATGVRLNQDAESSRVMGVFRRLEDTCLKPMVNMFWSLNMQFNDRPRTVQIVGPRGNTIEYAVGPDMFSDKRTFYAAGIKNVMQKDVQVHQMTNFLAIVGRIPPQMILAWKINVPEILKKIWENMGLDDAEAIIGGQEAPQVAQEAGQYGAELAMGDQMGANMANNLVPDMSQMDMGSMEAGNTAGGQQGTRIQ